MPRPGDRAYHCVVRSVLVVGLGLVLAAGACDRSLNGQTNDGGSQTQTGCDPLAPGPITLGAIVGVGQDAAGTFYVDAANGIFISLGGQLVRQHVTGTGQSGSQYLFTIEVPTADAAAAMNLLVDTQGSTATAMALGPAGSKAFLGQSDAGVTSLSLVTASAVSGLPVVNTPNQISYVGIASNQNVIVATVPQNENPGAKYGGLSIFYGPPRAVAQRTITDFQQSLSGNGTVTFLVGGVPYVLAFGMVQGPDAGPLGTFALLSLTPQGSAPLGVTLQPSTPSSLPFGDLLFLCAAP